MLRYYTTEYDGCTYKKEEPKEAKEKVTGSKYLLDYLEVDNDQKEELKRLITKMNTRSKWKDLSEKQERIYSKMEKILSKLRNYTPYATPFLNKVSKREAPEYYNLIKHPMDLGKIGKKIAMQEYSDVSEFVDDLALIWSNCFQFNHDHGNVYANYAQKMKEKSLILLQDLYAEREIEIKERPEEIAHFHATEKLRKEMTVSRTAILQRPQEFANHRTAHEMADFWKKETEACKDLQAFSLDKFTTLSSIIEANPPPNTRPYIPEYSHFHNSFPVFEPEPQPTTTYSLDSLLTNPTPLTNPILTPLNPSLTYHHRTFFQDQQPLPNLQISRFEVFPLLKRSIATNLATIGFTATESSALNILVSHTFFQIDLLLEAIQTLQIQIRQSPNPDPTQSTTDLILKAIIKKYHLKSTDLEPESFFSEEEEPPEEESLLDLIYSDGEDIEPLDDML
ncbi:hypothetical protein NEHOM01_1623 [Nematocida homosporus]|uniref:uncharacterized protein n=1 Tax=Nematocida homosporus TaxID=1912981 RepID=UPI002220F3B0|nr:uncharacterized protein NEHOM01_1623 [Nematocida homosporus]KAI5186670.1 hypothetical protein NEHOM01_1623 [Nematocida homosporus]